MANSDSVGGPASERDHDGLAFSTATGPIAATTIRTDAVGLHTRLGTIDAGDRAIRAYAAWPQAAAKPPIMLVISEAFGLNAHIADIARRFAHEGYFAVAPDLMVRQGDPMDFNDIGSLVSDLLLKIPDRQVMSDLNAVTIWAAAQGGDAARLSATGFCWGGRWTWLYAAHRPLLAAVAFYGILDGSGTFPDDPALFPRHPLDLVDELKTPVLGLHGGKDEAIPARSIEAMAAALRRGNAAAQASRIHIYPDAPHAFFADYRESFRTQDAADAWRRCLQWVGESNRSAVRSQF